MTNRALIAGATGAIGGALARHLATQPDWQVTGLSRKPPADPVDGLDYIHADLDDPDACRAALADHPGITHLFYCGRATHDDMAGENVAGNVALLRNLLDAAEDAHPLRHVHLVQGGKVYGVHVGPFPTPAREDDPRVAVPNFNYDQEDLLRERSAGAGWTWSASRPNTLLHYSPGMARNIVSTLAAYAALCRELGAALDFPGASGAYTSLSQVTSTDILSRAMTWMATDDKCGNHAFNITNGDVFRWQNLWPKLADAFFIPCGSVRPMRLADTMADKQDSWQRIVERHGLAQPSLNRVAAWSFADATLERYWDEILSTNKARAFGFHDWVDSEELFLALLARYREAGLLPG